MGTLSKADEAGYAPVASEDEVSLQKRLNARGTRKCKSVSWRLVGFVVGALGLAILVILDDAPRLLRRLLGRDDGHSTPDNDPLKNWGKNGTGTEQLAWYPTDFLRDVMPVACHSHNDYWRRVPLFSALEAGCTGVEADVWLRNGDLLVGHDTASLQPNRTFTSLYVDPLVQILEHQNPSTEFYMGSDNGVFDTDPSRTLVLLVDLKTSGAETWPWVMRQLQPLRERGWLSYYDYSDDKFHSRPITVVGTGNTPFELVLAGNVTTGKRDAFYDAPLDKLAESAYDVSNSYYASVSFWQAVGFVYWKGRPSEEQMEKIRSHLGEAHKRGLKSRYWELPAWPIHVRNQMWEVLVEEGIDMLNVDDLWAATREDWRKPGTF